MQERRQQDQHAHEHEARDLWCRGRTPGDPATFLPGEPLRCPGPRELRDTRKVVTCGCLLRGRPKPMTVVVIRVHKSYRAAIHTPGLDWPCHNCGSALEIFPILEATG